MINDWRLAKKMLVAFSLLGVMVAGLAVNGYVSNRALSSTATQHVEQGVASMSGLADLIGDIKEMRIIIYSFYNAVEAKDIAKLRERNVSAREDTLKHLDAYAKVAGDEFQGEVQALRTELNRLFTLNDRVFELRSAGDLPGALDLIKNAAKDSSRAAIDQSGKLLQMSRDRSQAANEAGLALSTNSMLITMALSLLTLGGLVGAWLAIARTVADPMAKLTAATTTLAEGGQAEVPHRSRKDELGQIASAVEQFRMAAVTRAEADARTAAEQQLVTASLRGSLQSLSNGDLTTDITADFPPAYAELKANYNAALASLRDVMGSVIEATAAINTGSTEIAAASEDLARRTEGNAASLEETSAAVTQMDARLKATATAATRTVERADGAIATVAAGRSVADEAVQAMSRVAEGAKGIDSVIEGLDKIAFQTRVLAMNAAVEAGRAGEAGRGFAVVADLVSALAMRSEEEASRARDQLTATQTDIVSAVEMVQKVDGSLADISNDVASVHELLGTMASDNQAQSTAITEISVAIGAMDHSTQQNAAMVEQTSAAARNLSGEVISLAEQAGRFTISAGGAPHRPAARPAPAPARPVAKAKPAAGGYVSPVKPLAAPAMASSTSSGDDWTSF